MKKDRLRAAINRSGIKQTRIAELLEVNVSTVSRWLSGDFCPTDDKKLKLAEILGTTVAYLMGETDYPCIGSTLLTDKIPMPEPTEKSSNGADQAKMAASHGNINGTLLTGEISQTPPPSEEKNSVVKMDFIHSSGQIIKVPIFERAYSACCGAGFPNADQIYARAEDFIDMPTSFIGHVSPETDKRPFMIYAEGDSMVQTGIIDGHNYL